MGAWHRGIPGRAPQGAKNQHIARLISAQLQQLDTQVGILTEQYTHIAADYKALADLLARV